MKFFAKEVSNQSRHIYALHREAQWSIQRLHNTTDERYDAACGPFSASRGWFCRRRPLRQVLGGPHRWTKKTFRQLSKAAARLSAAGLG